MSSRRGKTACAGDEKGKYSYMSINDPQWGRNAGSGNGSGAGDDDRRSRLPDEDQNQPNDDDRRDAEPRGSGDAQNDQNARGGDDRKDAQRKGSQENDLDQLWDDFNRMMGSILGGGRQQQRRPREEGARQEQRETQQEEFSFRDDRAEQRSERILRKVRRSGGRGTPVRASGRGLLALIGVAIIGWAATGIYIVPEGQVGVVTTFGRYTSDSAAGINWRAPWPIQDVEIVDVSSVRKAEIGINGSSSRLREALMLTDDENIVDVQFNVQYRIKPHQAKEYLFRSRDPDQSVIDAAESAMREVVGRKAMDSVLFESKQEIAASVQTAMQQMLDRYHTGIEVMSVAIQNAQPPEPVQAAFNDAVKAGQDRERQINEGQAYANAVVPAARGTASRLVQEAEGYKARVVETATGDAARFSMVLEQYQKAPKVTRDRIYIDAMRDIYASTKKVLVDSRSSSNLLYLPFDKLLEQSAQQARTGLQSYVQTPSSAQQPAAAGANSAVAPTVQNEYDPREALRMRGR